MAHIALVAYELEQGGISRVAVYLANGFAAAGHRVSLVLCSGVGDHHNTLRAMLDSGVEVVILHRRRFPTRALGQVLSWRALRRWIGRTRPDVVLGTANNVAWLSGMAVAGLGAGRPRLYVKTTNPILRKADGPRLTALRRKGYAWLFAAADGVLTLSEAESHLLARQFPAQAARFTAVFNPYHLDCGDASERPEPAPDAPARIVGLGRLAPQKAFDRALEAFALAKDRAPMRMTIAGEGPLRGALEAQRRYLGLENLVAFPGFTDDAQGLLTGADRFLLSSEYEGLPAVVIEALGCGCPVVATDCFPAARELLEGLPGCRVAALDAGALADALVGSLSDTVDREALRARARDYSLPSASASHLNAMGL